MIEWAATVHATVVDWWCSCSGCENERCCCEHIWAAWIFVDGCRWHAKRTFSDGPFACAAQHFAGDCFEKVISYSFLECSPGLKRRLEPASLSALAIHLCLQYHRAAFGFRIAASSWCAFGRDCQKRRLDHLLYSSWWQQFDRIHGTVWATQMERSELLPCIEWSSCAVGHVSFLCNLVVPASFRHRCATDASSCTRPWMDLLGRVFGASYASAFSASSATDWWAGESCRCRGGHLVSHFHSIFQAVHCWSRSLRLEYRCCFLWSCCRSLEFIKPLLCHVIFVGRWIAHWEWRPGDQLNWLDPIRLMSNPLRAVLCLLNHYWISNFEVRSSCRPSLSFSLNLAFEFCAWGYPFCSLATLIHLGSLECDYCSETFAGWRCLQRSSLKSSCACERFEYRAS